MNPSRGLYDAEVVRHILALREALVRHDENIKAMTLMDECMPYFLLSNEVVKQARDDQAAMTAHLRSEAVYAEYYGNNPYELPFEKMFGGDVAFAIENNGLLRVPWLIDELKGLDRCYNVLDVACNDGAIAKYIEEKVGCAVHGLDLNPTCIDRALNRGIKAQVGTIEDIHVPFDAVYAMEVIEHVPNPAQFLRRLAARAPHVYISTPYGATELGDVPNWATVEYKGHVRAVLPQDVKQWGDEAELELEFIGLTGDNIIVAHFVRGV